MFKYHIIPSWLPRLSNGWTNQTTNRSYNQKMQSPHLFFLVEKPTYVEIQENCCWHITFDWKIPVNYSNARGSLLAVVNCWSSISSMKWCVNSNFRDSTLGSFSRVIQHLCVFVRIFLCLHNLSPTPVFFKNSNFILLQFVTSFLHFCCKYMFLDSYTFEFLVTYLYSGI